MSNIAGWQPRDSGPRSAHANAHRRLARTTLARSRGFSLLELMTTVTVAAILASIAIPTFSTINRTNRMAAGVNDLVSALSIARSEAIRRGTRVSVCSSNDGATCTGGAWQQGWIVFADGAASDGANPVVSEVLRAFPAMPSITFTATMGWVRFLPRGTVRTTVTMPVTYNVSIDGCTGTQARAIELNAVGRASVSTGSCS